MYNPLGSPIALFVPSRGRPGNIDRLVEHLDDTTSKDTNVTLYVGLDIDDPHADDYIRRPDPPIGKVAVRVEEGLRVGCMATLNRMVQEHQQTHDIFGFLGDDHVIRTEKWDLMVMQALKSPGLCYGNDLIQGAALPTACFMSYEILSLLDFKMVPDVLYHLYCDNYWLMLGANTGCLRYLPGMVIEHRHPVAGTAEVDDGYRHVNSSEMYAKDWAAWEKFRDTELRSQVDKIKNALYGVTDYEEGD